MSDHGTLAAGCRVPYPVGTMRESLARRVKPFIFPLLLIGICAAGFIFRAPIVDLLGNREKLKAWVSSGGTWAPAVFFGLQVLQVVVFILPGEIVQVAGGFIFGFWGGAAISAAGIAAGSMVNYFVGRTLGRSFVGALVGESKLSRLETMVADPKAVASYFILFLIPGLPKDILCYLAGLGAFLP